MRPELGKIKWMDRTAGESLREIGIEPKIFRQGFLMKLGGILCLANRSGEWIIKNNGNIEAYMCLTNYWKRLGLQKL